VTDPADSSLRSLYEDPTVVVASGLDRARRQLALLEPVLDQAAAARRRLRILDVGCGDGAATALLAERAHGHTVVGADWSQMALERARRRGLTLLRASLDGCGLPIPDQSLDVVVFSEVIEHLVDTDAALDELVRVLRPGGSLLLSTPNLAAWFNRGLLLAGVQPVFTEVSLKRIYGRPGHEVVGHLRVFTRAALLGLLRGHGLDVVAVRGAAYHDTPRLLRPLDRLLQHVPELAADLIVHARTPRDRDTGGPGSPDTVPSAEDPMPLTAELLDLLACPVDKGPLLYDAETESLYNPRLRRAYPIVEGIPHLLADDARPVGWEEHERLTGGPRAKAELKSRVSPP
jgi:uncharacterized protein YbaR (Trm112 family)/SAM-dependent methyltransferase